jgi:Domain of unknown function (DUF4157)
MNGFEKINERMRRHEVFPRTADESDRPICATLSRIDQKNTKDIAFIPSFVAQASRITSRPSEIKSRQSKEQVASNSTVVGSGLEDTSKVDQPFENVKEVSENFSSNDQEIVNERDDKGFYVIGESLASSQDAVKNFPSTNLADDTNKFDRVDKRNSAGPKNRDVKTTKEKQLSSAENPSGSPEKLHQIRDVKNNQQLTEPDRFPKDQKLGIDGSNQLDRITQIIESNISSHLENRENAFSDDSQNKIEFFQSTERQEIQNLQNDTRVASEFDQDEESLYTFSIEKMQTGSGENVSDQSDFESNGTSKESFSYNSDLAIVNTEKLTTFPTLLEASSNSNLNLAKLKSSIKPDHIKDIKTSLTSPSNHQGSKNSEEETKTNVLSEVKIAKESLRLDGVKPNITAAPLVQNFEEISYLEVGKNSEVKSNLQGVDRVIHDAILVDNENSVILESVISSGIFAALKDQNQERGLDGSQVFFDQLGNDVVVFNPPKHNTRQSKTESRSTNDSRGRDSKIEENPDKNTPNTDVILKSGESKNQETDYSQKQVPLRSTQESDTEIFSKEETARQSYSSPDQRQPTSKMDFLEGESDDIAAVANSDYAVTDIQVSEERVENSPPFENISANPVTQQALDDKLPTFDLTRPDVLPSKPDLSVFSMPLPKLIRPQTKQRSQVEKKQLKNGEENLSGQTKESDSTDMARVLAEIKELKKFQQNPNSYGQQDLDTDNPQTTDSISVSSESSARASIPDEVLRQIEELKKLDPRFKSDSSRVQASTPLRTESASTVSSSSVRTDVPDEILRQIEELKKLDPRFKSGSTRAQALSSQSENLRTRSDNFQVHGNTSILRKDLGENQPQASQISRDLTPTSNSGVQYSSRNQSPENSGVTKEGLSRLTSNIGDTIQIPERTRRFLKPLVGIDPIDVKIVGGEAARAITQNFHADALTIGETILLPHGNVDSPESIGLIAHELTHVARNRDSRFIPAMAQKNASVFQADEETIALQVESQVRAFVEADQKMRGISSNAESTVNSGSASARDLTPEQQQNFGDMPAPWELPDWMRNPSLPIPNGAQANNLMPATNVPAQPMPVIPAPMVEAPSFIQAAAQNRNVPANLPAPGANLEKRPAENEAGAGAASAPDLDELAQQVYRRLKRRIAEEQRRQSF